MSRQIVVPVEEPGQRVDKLLSAALEDLTRSAVQNLIENGCVTCQGKPLTKSAKLKVGDQVLVELPEVRPLEVLPEEIPLSIVYEDGDLLVVNKPKGMVVHPAPGHESGTLVNALLAHCGDSLSGINGVARPGIVHRIDKDTSGLLIVAKNDFSHTRLAEQIQAHTFTREYSAVVYGSFKEEKGTVEENGGAASFCFRKTGCDPFLGGQALSGIYPAPSSPGNRENPSNPGTHGLSGTSRSGGSSLRPQESDCLSGGPMPPCGEDRLYSSPNRRIPGI